MEDLSRRLNRLSLDKDFRYHPKCKRVNLTHLMFAHDLLIFGEADEKSIISIRKALEDFSGWSGLSINFEKSCIFFGGVSVEKQSSIADRAGLTIGKLPILLYLGIPLDGKALNVTNYNPNIEKMMGKITPWTSRCLSYAGRLIFIRHVLAVICSYWMRSLLVPKEVIKRNTSICRSYLWSGLSSSGRSLVGWKDVCMRKEQGGPRLVRHLSL